MRGHGAIQSTELSNTWKMKADVKGNLEVRAYTHKWFQSDSGFWLLCH